MFALVAAAILALGWQDLPKGDARASPLSPRDERATFRTDAGLEIELVANEPQVQSPVAMAFDENGRLWVVEMLDYPNGPKPGEKAAGRIKLLEDHDADGFYEHASVFADELLFANGIMPWKGGVIVTAAPHILYLKDEDGDGRADRRDVWWEGFKAGNPQLRVSHPILGLDGYVYVVNGLQGGKIKRPGQPDSEAIDISGRDFKFDPRTMKGEAIAGMGQYGNTFDDWGRRFVCTNRNHIIPIMFEEKYAKRNPYLVVPPPLTDNQSAGGAARTYPISRNFTTASTHAGSFSAACGITIYRGDLLGPDYYGCAFTCDPTGNLVHQEIIEPDGAGFKWHPPHPGVEFFASTDDWCRPVFLSHGPDGALYIVDMYRAVIEHPEWMPPELKNRPDLELGKDKGRIWRVVPKGAKVRREAPKLSEMKTHDLVAVLDNPNAWHRVTAQRLLLEREDPEITDHLTCKAAKGKFLTPWKTDLGLLHVAWLQQTLENRVEDYTFAKLCSRDGPVGLTENALRLAEHRDPNAKFTSGLFLLSAHGGDLRLKFQAALSCGAWATPYRPIIKDIHEPPPKPEPGDSKWSILAECASTAYRDRWVRLAVESAIDRESGWLIRQLVSMPLFDNPFVADESDAARDFFAELWQMVGRRYEEWDIREALMALRIIEYEQEQEGKKVPSRWPLVGLSQFAKSLRKEGQTLHETLTKLCESDDIFASGPAKSALGFMAGIPRLASDRTLDPRDRLCAIQLLSECDGETARKTLLTLLHGDETPDITAEAARTLSRLLPDAQAVAPLVEAYAKATPSLRHILIQELISEPTRSLSILQAVDAGSLPDTAFDALQVKQLINDSREDVRTLARQVLANRIPADRTAVIERYRQALAQPGDVTRGRTVFRNRCTQCHRVENEGNVVGPDISDTLGKSPEALLQDILNPNASIDGNYQVYSVATKDGRVLSGIVAAESASNVTLKRAEGQTDTVLRQDIEEMHPTGMSLMPDGIENDISPEAMADLIAYLKKWRYEQIGVPVK